MFCINELCCLYHKGRIEHLIHECFEIVFDNSILQDYALHLRRGNPWDNVMAESFFSIFKTECIYRHKPSPFREENAMIDRYIDLYNNERIQTKFGVAPLSLRHS